MRHQTGAGGPWENTPIIFHGKRGQRGFGFFGSFLSGLGKIALPIAKKFGKKVLKQAVAVGKDVLIEGKRPREALKQRGKELITSALTGQLGSGLKKRRKRKPQTSLGETWILPKRARRK